MNSEVERYKMQISGLNTRVCELEEECIEHKTKKSKDQAVRENAELKR